MLMANLVRSQVNMCSEPEAIYNTERLGRIASHSAFTPIFFLAYSLTLKMKAIYSSEMSVDYQRITERYIPEESTLHSFLIKKYLFQ
jgi:hypothetical protein